MRYTTRVALWIAGQKCGCSGGSYKMKGLRRCSGIIWSHTFPAIILTLVHTQINFSFLFIQTYPTRDPRNSTKWTERTENASWTANLNWFLSHWFLSLGWLLRLLYIVPNRQITLSDRIVGWPLALSISYSMLLTSCCWNYINHPKLLNCIVFMYLFYVDTMGCYLHVIHIVWFQGGFLPTVWNHVRRKIG